MSCLANFSVVILYKIIRYILGNEKLNDLSLRKQRKWRRKLLGRGWIFINWNLSSFLFISNYSWTENLFNCTFRSWNELASKIKLHKTVVSLKFVKTPSRKIFRSKLLMEISRGRSNSPSSSKIELVSLNSKVRSLWR